MNKKLFFLAALFAIFIGDSACKMDDDIADVTPNDVDYDFMTKASYANRGKIDFAQLALTRSTNDSVKAFAEMIIADHTAALTSLESLATRYNFSLPGTIDSVHVALKLKLIGFSGYSFDTAYINGQIKDHTTALNLYRNEISNGFEPVIKKYAAEHLPHLEMHLQEADSLKTYLQ